MFGIQEGHLYVTVGLKNATDTKPATDWDLADIWHATSSNGIDWVESKLPAVKRPPKPEYGSRSICTPGILIWKGKYYLFFSSLCTYGWWAGVLSGSSCLC